MKVKVGDFDWNRMKSNRDKTCHDFYQKLKKILFLLDGKKEKIFTTSTSLETTTKASSSAQSQHDHTQPDIPEDSQTRSKASSLEAQPQDDQTPPGPRTRSKVPSSEAQPQDDQTRPGPRNRSNADITPKPTLSKEAILAKIRAKDRKELARKQTAKKGTHLQSAANVRQKAIKKNNDKVNKNGEQLPLRATKRKVQESTKPVEYYNEIISKLWTDHSKKLKLKKF